MEQRKQHRAMPRRVPMRIAAAALALGSLSASALVTGTATASATVVVSTTKNATLGTILVSGKTLYTLKASKVACNAQCVKIWPELVLPKGVTRATAGHGVSASKLGTVMRPGGVRQVTYGGKALYRFVGDRAAGQVHGDVTDTWGKWTVVVTAKPASSGSSGATNGGTGGAAF